MYPLGSVLRLKTTGENVVIIGDVVGDDDKVVVRRPTNTQDKGVQHETEQFNLFELDTVEESIRREFNEVKIRQAIITAEQEKNQPPATAEFVQ